MVYVKGIIGRPKGGEKKALMSRPPTKFRGGGKGSYGSVGEGLEKAVMTRPPHQVQGREIFNT